MAFRILFLQELFAFPPRTSPAAAGWSARGLFDSRLRFLYGNTATLRGGLFRALSPVILTKAIHSRARTPLPMFPLLLPGRFWLRIAPFYPPLTPPAPPSSRPLEKVPFDRSSRSNFPGPGPLSFGLARPLWLPPFFTQLFRHDPRDYFYSCFLLTQF